MSPPPSVNPESALFGGDAGAAGAASPLEAGAAAFSDEDDAAAFERAVDGALGFEAAVLARLEPHVARRVVERAHVASVERASIGLRTRVDVAGSPSRSPEIAAHRKVQSAQK